MRDYFADFSQRLQLEKLVIGLEEPIFIKSIGEFVAKVDSGNGGYNVIHGEDAYQNGGVLVFKTYDKNNELKQVSKKLIQFINVNIGSGKVEQRPVIELDVKIGDREYNKIPFSVANRSSNSHKVLICKDFIQNQLDALIDVSGKMLTQKGVEVEYLNEANILTKAVKSVGDLTGINGMRQKIKDQGGFIKSIAAGFQGAGKYTDVNIIGGIVGKDVKKAAEYDKIVDADRKLILRKLGQQDANVLIYKLIDYQGKYYNGKDVCEAEKAHFAAFQKGNKTVAQADQQHNNNSVNNNQGKPEGTSTFGDSFEYKLIKKILLEATPTDLPTGSAVKPVANNGVNPTTPPTGTNQQSKPAVAQGTNQAQTPEPPVDTQTATEYKTVSELYNVKRQRFCVYFIQVAQSLKSKAGKYDTEVKRTLQKNQFPITVNRFFKNFIGENKLTFTQQSGNDKIVQRFIPDVNYLPETELSKNIQTTFAICFGDLGTRKVWLSSAATSTSGDDNLAKLDFFANKMQGSGNTGKLIKKYQKYYAAWAKNDILKHQNLDLTQTEFNQQLATSISTYFNAVQDPDNDFMTLVKSDYQQTNEIPVDLHLKEIFANEQKAGYVQKQLADANNIVAGINAMISSQNSNSKDKMPPEVWNQLIKYTYEGIPVEQTGQTQETVDETLKQWKRNVFLNYLIRQLGGDISNLDDNDKAKIASLVQQRIATLSWSSNKALKAISQIVNPGQLSQEDKAQLVNLIQQRITNSSWANNQALKAISQIIQPSQLSREDKIKLVRLIQQQINGGQSTNP